jgi:hypothetical protein
LTKRATTITIWRNSAAKKIEHSAAFGSILSGRTKGGSAAPREIQFAHDWA